MKVISISAQKGGVGKTSVTFHLCGESSARGLRTLVCDVDPQGSLSSTLLSNVDSLPYTVRDLLLNPDLKACQVIQKTRFANIDILPCNYGLGLDEMVFLSDPTSQYLLTNRLEEIKQQYDLVLIDTPPDLRAFTQMALVAADFVLMPMECSGYGVKSTLHLIELVIKIKKNVNPDLRLLGFVINKISLTRTVEQSYLEMMRKKFGSYVFKTEIKNSVRYLEAITQRTPITLHQPKSDQAEAYRRLFDEIQDSVTRAASQAAGEK